MVTPRVVTWNKGGVGGEQVPGLIAVREMTSGGDLKRLGLEVEILLVLQIAKNRGELEGGKGKNQWELHEEFGRL
jgi:hypothetical protein